MRYFNKHSLGKGQEEGKNGLQSPGGASKLTHWRLWCHYRGCSVFGVSHLCPSFLLLLSSYQLHQIVWGYPSGSVVKNPPAKVGGARDAGSIPVLGRSREGGNIGALQCPCLENSMDRRAWKATVHEVAESDMAEQYHSLIHFQYVYYCFLTLQRNRCIDT